MGEWKAKVSGLSLARGMESLALLAVLMGAQWSKANRVCGQPPVHTNRIVQGKDTVAGEFPWQVSLQWKGVHVCGGSLITDQWVISAAHCFYQLRNLTQYQVVLGAHQLLNPGPHWRSSSVQRIISNPRYEGKTSSGDIALVHLATRVNFTDYILPICLPDASVQFSPGKRCWVTGWGHIHPWKDLQSPQTLQKLEVPIIDSKTCKSLYNINMQNKPTFRTIQDDMICAGYAEGMKDACNGDSGGPLVCPVNDSWVLAGVVSWGESCALKNRPGVYSRLTYYQNWIWEHIPNLEFIKDSNNREPRDKADIKGQNHREKEVTGFDTKE